MNGYYIAAGVIVSLGLLFLLYSSLKTYKRHKAIKHYEEIRDKLTIREKEEKEVELNYSGGLGLGNLIGGFIVILVGVTLFPSIKDAVAESCSPQFMGNVTSAATVCGGSTETMIGLITLFFALCLL